MIINTVNIIHDSNIAQYSWRRLAQFHNIEFTAKHISNLHGLNSKQIGNAKRQAEQIKYCLIQAKEYFDASMNVTLATRPLLLYYCTMSLALAEILIKQTADSRLSKLRENHNCHGLSLTMVTSSTTTDSLTNVSNQLVAKAQIDQHGNPKGTFEVWRQSAREFPLGGYFTSRHGLAFTKGYRALFGPSDEPPPSLPNTGISLHQCLTNLPYLADTLARWSSRLEMVRATVANEMNNDTKQYSCTISIHPVSADLFDLFTSLCIMHPELVNHINITELPSGCIIQWDPSQPFGASFPHATCITDQDTFFTCSKENLGEFGYLYISLHILGNFARYYPDFWIKHIEANSPLANTVDDLCNNALNRLPLLALSELSRTYYVIEK
jgi:hypothetical protein